MLTEIKMRGDYDFHDFLHHLGALKSPSFKDVIARIPGIFGKESPLARYEAIIHSMTRLERTYPAILNESRKVRIARGSGATIDELNEFLHRFSELKSLISRLKY